MSNTLDDLPPGTYRYQKPIALRNVIAPWRLVAFFGASIALAAALLFGASLRLPLAVRIAFPAFSVVSALYLWSAFAPHVKIMENLRDVIEVSQGEIIVRRNGAVWGIFPTARTHKVRGALRQLPGGRGLLLLNDKQMYRLDPRFLVPASAPDEN
jgi:hypothetical protein